MRNRLLSAAVALSLLLSAIPAATAQETLTTTTTTEASTLTSMQSSVNDPYVAYLASLDSFTMTSVNPDSTSLEQDGQNRVSTSFTDGVVLFALAYEADFSRLATEFAALGLSDIQPVLHTDTVVSTDDDSSLVWYRATCADDELNTATKLRNISGVAAAELEYLYHMDAFGEPSAAEVNCNWAVDNLLKKSNKFWWNDELSEDVAPGAGTIVAVIDTGVDYTHEDLSANMWTNTAELNGTTGVDDDGNGYIDDIYGANVTASGKQAGDPMDDNGHGTHVAGIIAMSSNQTGAVGIAWGSKIMAIKAGQSTGSFTSSDIAEAIQYAQMMGADVINMSFGGTAQSYLVEQALSAAFSDCVLVASAGNDGVPTTDSDWSNSKDFYPAGYSYVLGVMATDSNDDLASFSNWDYTNNANAEYELTAPGVEIYSTLPGNRYATWSGTSMAAPFVSAAAAIIRSKYTDTSTYSSRFIMGQLASATNGITNYADKLGNVHTYAALDIYDSCVNLPTPNLAVPQLFALDNVTTSNEINDGDRIIDAGETIDLGFTVRNQWGQTGTISVTADAVSNGTPNPYVTFVTDTVTLSPVGTFGEIDNGYVWEDSYLSLVSNPIRFTLASNTPNDTEITITLTISTTNGFDKTDKTKYTTEATYTFRVQCGRGIRGALTQDTTLTSEHYWIVEDTLYIPSGITLTVEPGTQIQFGSSDYEGSYGDVTIPSIVYEGTLNMIGAEDAPISCFPGAGFESHMTQIWGTGNCTLQYCEITNPWLGVHPYYVHIGNHEVDLIDHCVLTQTPKSDTYLRVANPNGTISTNSVQNARNAALKMSNSRLYGLAGPASWGQWSDSNPIYFTADIENCLFNDSTIDFNLYSNEISKSKNSVFLPSESTHPSAMISTCSIGTATLEPSSVCSIYTYEGAESKYIYIGYSNRHCNLTHTAAQEIAETLGGHLMILNDATEETFLQEMMTQTWTDCGMDSMSSRYLYADLNYTYDHNTGTGSWADGNSYQPAWFLVMTQDLSAPHHWAFYGYDVDEGSPGNTDGVMYGLDLLPTYDSARTTEGYLYCYYVEVPSSMTDEAICTIWDNLDIESLFKKSVLPDTTNNAILNPVLDTSASNWIIFRSTANQKYSSLSGNYWGTENKTLINKMITDAEDRPGTLGEVIEDPILTLDSESLEDIYPFTTAVWLEDENGNVVTSVSQGATYKVHVTYNRDMNPDVQPTVSYGPASPYTDFIVQGDWISAREWVGETTVSPAMTQGTQYFRTTGGSAADDGWLICGNDTMRFSFKVTSTGALAMTLQATSGAGKIELNWLQDDFDTLAGYNLYRSTIADGDFTKINTTILSEETFTDTNVEEGVVYYYYFKVVNTDGNEEETVSNVASATPLDAVAPTISHTPITTGNSGSSITLSATVTDNISVNLVTLYYRISGATSYSSRNMIASGNAYIATIPASSVTKVGVEYYIKAVDSVGNVTYSGTKEKPNFISTSIATAQLDAPTVSVTTSASSGKPIISWTEVECSTGYEVWCCSSKNGTYKLLTTTVSSKLSVIHTGAVAGEDYFYKVKALYSPNTTYNSSFSTAKGVWCDLPVPTIKVTNRASDGKPTISWSKVEGATGYEVYRCGTSGGTYVKMYTAPADDFDVVHTGAAVGNDYFYKVRAIYSSNSKCNSAYSAAKGVWVDLKQPTIKVLNSVSSGKPVISWGKVDYAVGYKVYCATGSSTGTYKLIYSTTNPDKLSVTHVGAKAGEAYFYKVVAIHKNSKCTSVYSAYKGVYCDLARPTLAVELNSKGKPYLSWTEVDGADGYKVYRSTDGSSWTLMYTAKADDFDVNHTGAISGTTYYYKVFAVCNATSKGNSAYSAVQSITVE